MMNSHIREAAEDSALMHNAQRDAVSIIAEDLHNENKNIKEALEKFEIRVSQLESQVKSKQAEVIEHDTQL